MKKIIVGGIITFCVSAAIVAAAWNFSQVVEIPEKYATRSEVKDSMCKLEKKIDWIIDYLMTNGRCEE